MRNLAKFSVFCQNIESNQYFLVFLKKCMGFAVIDIDLDMSLPVLCTTFVNCPSFGSMNGIIQIIVVSGRV